MCPLIRCDTNSSPSTRSLKKSIFNSHLRILERKRERISIWEKHRLVASWSEPTTWVYALTGYRTCHSSVYQMMLQLSNTSQGRNLNILRKNFVWVMPYFRILKKCIETCFFTDQFCGLIWPLVDKRFKGFLHQVDELLIPLKAYFYHMVHSVLKIQQVLHHIFIFFRIDNNRCPKSL